MDNKQIQERLNLWSKDKLETGNLSIDGIIGSKTRNVIKAFQKSHGLIVDGIPGAHTQYELMFYKYNNFSKKEFKCNCGGKYCNGYPVFIDEGLIIYLQKMRDYFKRSVIVTSGLRCRNYNKDVGGVDDSQHLLGRAADIKVNGISTDMVYNYANQINVDGCIIRYNTFNHLDRRGYRLRLDYRK